MTSRPSRFAPRLPQALPLSGFWLGLIPLCVQGFPIPHSDLLAVRVVAYVVLFACISLTILPRAKRKPGWMFIDCVLVLLPAAAGVGLFAFISSTRGGFRITLLEAILTVALAAVCGCGMRMWKTLNYQAAEPMRCEFCGYDMGAAASAGDVCPECGKARCG